VRTFPGGCGGFNLGSNFATTILQHAQATQKGFHQNLWLSPDGYLTQASVVQKPDFFFRPEFNFFHVSGHWITLT